ncbi:MAG: hypothetical protein WCK02_03770 [Bacteroidota bacterium]
MRFNKYVWDLYKDSIKGKGEINKWSKINDFSEIINWREIDNENLDGLKLNNLKKYIDGNKVNWVSP